MDTYSKIKFHATQKSLFFSTLKKRVDEHFEQTDKSRYANKAMKIKSVVLLSAYIIPFVVLLFTNPPLWISLFLWVVMGLGISGIGMSVMHDANHGAFSKNPAVNKWMGYTIHLAGVGVLNWKLQHNILHHTYTNVPEVDEDIKDRGVIKLSPDSGATRFHRFQWIYAFFFYGILTLYWVLVKDFLQFYTFIKSGLLRQSIAENRQLLAGLIGIKVVYFGILFVLPVVVFNIPFLEILLGFSLMHFTSGLMLTVIFQLAHSVEGTHYPVANSEGVIENDWAIHQLETTVDFSPRNKWLGWYVGGLNFQIEHHLFPKVCHIHYAALAPIVKKTAEEFGLKYSVNDTFILALKSHISSLRRFGTPHLNEAIG